MNPDALGATLYGKQHCYAEYGTTIHTNNGHRYCVFPSGNMILSIKIFIPPGYLDKPCENV